MSWIWPHPAEYESSPPVDIPTRVTAFDGRAWIETREFPSEDAAADYARHLLGRRHRGWTGWAGSCAGPVRGLRSGGGSVSAPYYSDDLVTLYHGDNREVLPTLSDVDLIVTSPPYNLGVTTGGGFGHYKAGQKRGGQGKWGGAGGDGISYIDHDDAMPYPEYEAWQREVLTACWATLSDRGAIFYNHKPRVQASQLWMPLELNPGLPLRQIIIWKRAGGMNFAPTHYVPTHEWICVFAKPGFRLKSKGASGVGDVWTIPQDGKNDHPAPFPIGLPAQAIETTAPRLVLDPHSGSGTTLRAARDAGVPSIGIERSERYCEMTARRLDQGVLDFGEVSA